MAAGSRRFESTSEIATNTTTIRQNNCVQGINPYYEAREVTGALWKRDIDCYSPIAACYQTALFEEIDLVDNEFWLRRNLPHMQASRALVILRHDNWEKSDGIKEEIDFFDKRNSPIYSLDYPVKLNVD